MSKLEIVRPAGIARQSLGERMATLRRDMSTREARSAYLFMLPSLVILTVFVFWPIFQSFLLSFYHWSFGSSVQQWAGLDNYQRLIPDQRVWSAFRNTLYYAAITVPVTMALSLVLALA